MADSNWGEEYRFAVRGLCSISWRNSRSVEGFNLNCERRDARLFWSAHSGPDMHFGCIRNG